MAATFEERFAKRAGAVEESEGFEEFLLLRPSDGSKKFFVFTRWASEEAYEAWLASRDFAQAHASEAKPQGEGGHPGGGHPGGGHPGGGEAGGGHPGGQAPVAVANEILSFDVVERVTK